MADSDEFYKQENHEDDNQPVENAYDPFQPIEDGAASMDAGHFQTNFTERNERQDTVTQFYGKRVDFQFESGINSKSRQSTGQLSHSR